MHCLYRLQPQYREQGQELHISPLFIQLRQSAETGTESTELSNTVGIQAYYLDWSNFEAATPETVYDLLQNFWKKYAAVDQTAAALQVLDLDETADWSQVQAQYRRLAAEHHPDKGGDRAEFAKVREAYEVLKVKYKL